LLPWLFLLDVHAVEILGERVELLFPELPGFDNPACCVDHGARVQTAAVDASLLAARNESGAFQDSQVPRDRRGRDTVGRGQVAHGRFTARQMADDSPPDRVGQGGEHGVER
jgi:hypothetical protein